MAVVQDLDTGMSHIPVLFGWGIGLGLGKGLLVHLDAVVGKQATMFLGFADVSRLAYSTYI